MTPMRFAALLAALAACSGAPRATTPPATDVKLPAALEPLRFMLGAWHGAAGDTVETWTFAGDALFGVTLGPGDHYEVMLVHEHQGAVRFLAMPGGAAAVAFTMTTPARFENPAHDFPRVIAYAPGGGGLTAEISDGAAKIVPYAWSAITLPPAPELESADLAFAAETAELGSEGWVKWFDPEGVMWRGDAIGRVQGKDAIRETMTKALDDPAHRLEWSPAASGLGPGGTLGFTVGTWDYIETSPRKVLGRGAYVTVWRKQPDGTWRVLFDTGDEAGVP
jgi:hypothetical protein